MLKPIIQTIAVAVAVVFAALTMNMKSYASTKVVIASESMPCKGCSHLKLQELEQYRTEQYSFLNALDDADAIVVTGRLTATGAWGEFISAKTALTNLKKPVFFGLGDTDYLDSITSKTNPDIGIRGIRYLKKHIEEVKAKKPPYDKVGNVYFDFLQGTLGVTGSTKRTNTVGRLAYSVELGEKKDVVLIQLNAHVDGKYNRYYFEGQDLNFGMSRNYITINPVVDWLANRLEYFAKKPSPPKAVIVAMSAKNVDPAITNLLHTYGVQFRFLGNDGTSPDCAFNGGTYECVGFTEKNKVLEIKIGDTTADIMEITLRQPISVKEKHILLKNLRPQLPEKMYPAMSRVVMFSHNGAYHAYARVLNSHGNGIINSEIMDMYGQHIVSNMPKLDAPAGFKLNFLFSTLDGSYDEVLPYEEAQKLRSAATTCVITSGFAWKSSRNYYVKVKETTTENDISDNQCHDTWFSHPYE